MDWSPIVEKVILVVITVGLPLFLNWLLGPALTALVAYYEARVDEKLRYELADLVNTAVQAAEQLGLTGQLEAMGKQKFDYAMDLVDAELKERGLNIDLKLIQAMIEAQVKQAFNTPRGNG